MISIPKLLILIIVIAAIYFFFIKNRKKSEDKEVEQMVECAECGTYISNKESIIKAGKLYCSKECAKIK